MTKEQQIQVRKLNKQQCIKPATKQTSANNRIAALKSKLGTSSQPKEGDDTNTVRESQRTSIWKEQRESCAGFPGILCKVQGTQLTPRVIKRENQHELC